MPGEPCRHGDLHNRLIGVTGGVVEDEGADAVSHPHLFRLMFSTELRDRQPEVGPAALAALVEPLDLRVPADVAVRGAWALAHGLATLRLGGMLTFTRDDSAQRLRDELGALRHRHLAGSPDRPPEG